ncbi:MAG: PAS domain-containing sensor histidine kinase [Myxococcota bacterium]
MRLWLKLALAMVAVAMAPLAVVSVQALDVTSDQADEAQQAARSREAVAVADELARWVRLKAQAVAGWANLYPDLLEREPAVQDGFLRAVYRAIPGAVTVALLDEEGLAGPRGNELSPVWLDRALPPGDPLSNRPRGSTERASAFAKIVPRPSVPGEVRLGRPFDPPVLLVGAPKPPPTLPIAARGPFDSPATVAVELSLDELEALLAARATEDRGFTLVSQGGRVLLSKGPAVDIRPLQPLMEQGEVTFDVEDGRAGALAAVPGIPWTVVMTEAPGPDTAWPALRTRLLVALGLSLVVAVAAGLIVGRTVSRPVREVRAAVNRVADGELDHRVPVAGGDEIAELAAAFNHMSGRLAATLAELDTRRREVEAFNEELQDRVRERTHDLEAAQAELVRAGQLAAVGEVGAGLAHELNNPLSSVLGLVQLVQLKTTDETQRGLLGQAEAQALRCREVMEAMLRLSAPTPTTGESRSELGSALAEVGRLVGGALRQRGVTLTLASVESGLWVATDPTELRAVLAQVVQGLASGLPEGGSLSLSAVRNQDSVEVRIQPDRDVDAGARRDDYRAAGLGLWVARRLLASHGGSLQAPSPGEEAWRLILPVA